MSRMKTFFKYLILFLLFYLFVSFLSYGFIRSTLRPMESGVIDFQSPEITVQDAEVSKVNGYVKGVIKNNTGDSIKNKYVKFDFISDKNNLIISKYIDISNMDNNAEKTFDVEFNAENIVKCKISLSDTGEEKLNAPNKQELGEVLVGLFFGWVVFFNY